MLRTVLVALILLAAVAVAPPAEARTPAFTDAGGLHVVSAQQVDARLWKLHVTTPALAGHTVRVNVLLPSGYAANPTRRYPVLYLYHGTSGGADDWLNLGGAEQTTAGLNLITVIPDAGFDGDGGGWFTNWVDQRTKLGPSQWETYENDQLVPFVDHNLRTIANRTGRAIAGLSQGGYGAFSLAARHPDLFLTAASFSGAPDIGTNPVVEAGGRTVIDATEVGLDGGVEPDAAFGSPLTDELNYQGHNPGTLVDNLRPLGLYLWAGNGVPGPYDSPGDPAVLGGVVVESVTHASTLSFAAVARRAGVAYHLDDYGRGTHSWPYWARDLRQLVGPMMSRFAHPPAAPTSVSYRSVEPSWSQWGWTVTRSGGQAWTALAAASARGFTFSGPASAVTTPADYRAGSTHRVTVGGRVTPVRADSHGRLTLSVPASGSATAVGIS